MPKLDKIDLRILYELDRDCRAPFSAIGRLIRKSPQYVKYRVDRLKTEGVIQSVAVIPPLAAGTLEAYAFVKLKGSDITEEKMLLDFLFKLPETSRLNYCDGAFDIVATFLVKNYLRLEEIKSLLAQFSNIDKIFFNAAVDAEIYIKKYLQQPFEAESVKLKRDGEELDELTRQTLFELQKNPFAALLEISNSLKVSYDRIKYLFKKSPYLGSRLVLSNRVVKKAVLFIDAAKDLDKIRAHAAVNPFIVQMDVILGEYPIVLYFECLAQDEIHRYIKEFLYKFKDSIQGSFKLSITNTYKYWWLS